ncbi:MAG: hypothetical protein C0480_00630 [Bradyrhizobium sp.]|nr:hypothetical protein [Bradyrhizobium sp.]
MTGIIHEWRRLSQRFADINGKACAAAEEAKAAMQDGAEPGIPYSPLTVAKFDRAVDLLAEARHLMSQLIEVHAKLFPDDQKIFEVEAMVQTSVEKIEAYRDRLHPTKGQLGGRPQARR